MRNRQQLICLFARHGDDTYAEALGNLKDHLRKLYPSMQVRILVLDTRDSNGMKVGEKNHIESDIDLFQCDNTNGEFGAWAAGLNHLRELGIYSGPVLLVTSAFENGGSKYLRNFGEYLFNVDKCGFSIFGHIDYYDIPIHINEIFSQHWVRTSFVQTRLEVMLKLHPFLPELPKETELFDFKGRSLFNHENAFLSTEYKQLVENWLTGRNFQQGAKWHSATSLTPESAPGLRFKARMIIFEHLFTTRLHMMGIRAIDPASITNSNQVMKKLDMPWYAQIWNRGYSNDRTQFHFNQRSLEDLE